MKPILFNTDMVRRIDHDDKTCTRRVAKNIPEGTHSVLDINDIDRSVLVMCSNYNFGTFGDDVQSIKPPFWKNDILYVRETWQQVYETEADSSDPRGYYPIRELILNFDDIPKVEAGLSHESSTAQMPARMKYYIFRAHEPEMQFGRYGKPLWRSAMHMPKEAARLFLRIVDIDLQQLQDIEEEDAIAEGAIALSSIQGARDVFHKIWDSTLSGENRNKYCWDMNPWVWVYQFEKISKEEALLWDTPQYRWKE